MAQKPELKSPPLFAAPLMPPERASSSVSVPPPPLPPTPKRIPTWLERGELFLRVMIRMYIGLAICYAPWSHLLWDQNPLFVHFPTLSIIAANGAVRGLVSGLGLLNLWIAFSDVIRRRQD